MFFCKKLYNINWSTDNIVQEVILYYFIGLVISRIGSLLLEPLFKKICKNSVSSYKDYIDASQEDTKIELLSEVNNTFRTMISLGFVSLMTDIVMRFSPRTNFISHYYTIALAILFIALFSASYIKQTKMVSQRVNRAIEKKDEKNSQEATSTIIMHP